MVLLLLVVVVLVVMVVVSAGIRMAEAHWPARACRQPGLDVARLGARS